MEMTTATQSKKATGPDGDASGGTSTKEVGNQTPCPADQKLQHADGMIAKYLKETVAEFRELSDLRQKVSSTSEIPA